MISPVTYYGSKNRLAGRIIDAMTPHRYYIEPYCGSAAVLLSKEAVEREVINDIDDEVVNFFRVLRDHPTRLKRALTLTPYAHAERDLCRNSTVDPVERARRFLAVSCMSYNGQRAGRVGFSHSNPGKNQPRPFTRAVDSLDQVATRLRGVEIENIDALRLIERWDHRDTTLYVDPPYLSSTRSATGNYTNDTADREHHHMLLSRLELFAGEVVLSSYPNDLYESMLRQWERREFAVDAPTAKGRGNSTRRIEVLWIKRREVA